MTKKHKAIRGNAFRGKIVAGDLFSIQVRRKTWVSGRVICTDANAFAIDKLYLVYIYNEVGPKPIISTHPRPPKLLIPPLLTTRSPWSFGLFEPVGNMPIVKDELLKRHCFYSELYQAYYDEYSKEVVKCNPIGSFGVHGDQSIEEEVLDALL